MELAILKGVMAQTAKSRNHSQGIQGCLRPKPSVLETASLGYLIKEGDEEMGKIMEEAKIIYPPCLNCRWWDSGNCEGAEEGKDDDALPCSAYLALGFCIICKARVPGKEEFCEDCLEEGDKMTQKKANILRRMEEKVEELLKGNLMCTHCKTVVTGAWYDANLRQVGPVDALTAPCPNCGNNFYEIV